jgi:DNA polymerase-1
LLLDQNLRPYNTEILNLIHDELVIECPEAYVSKVKDIVVSCMVAAGERFLPSVPVEVDMVVDKVWRK